MELRGFGWVKKKNLFVGDSAIATPAQKNCDFSLESTTRRSTTITSEKDSCFFFFPHCH